MSAERSWDDEVEDNESDSDDEEALSAGAPPRRRRAPGFQSENEDEQESIACPICADPLASRQVLALPCGHPFHQDCVEDWHDRQHRDGAPRTCPVCRTGSWNSSPRSDIVDVTTTDGSESESESQSQSDSSLFDNPLRTAAAAATPRQQRSVSRPSPRSSTATARSTGPSAPSARPAAPAAATGGLGSAAPQPAPAARPLIIRVRGAVAKESATKDRLVGQMELRGRLTGVVLIPRGQILVVDKNTRSGLVERCVCSATQVLAQCRDRALSRGA